MRVATLIVATALGLGTCVTTAPAAVISGGHATSGTQFGHGGFGHHFHHQTVVFPYGYCEVTANAVGQFFEPFSILFYPSTNRGFGEPTVLRGSCETPGVSLVFSGR